MISANEAPERAFCAVDCTGSVVIPDGRNGQQRPRHAPVPPRQRELRARAEADGRREHVVGDEPADEPEAQRPSRRSLAPPVPRHGAVPRGWWDEVYHHGPGGVDRRGMADDVPRSDPDAGPLPDHGDQHAVRPGAYLSGGVRPGSGRDLVHRRRRRLRDARHQRRKHDCGVRSRRSLQGAFLRAQRLSAV